jgi:hypothetical protein
MRSGITTLVLVMLGAGGLLVAERMPRYEMTVFAAPALQMTPVPTVAALAQNHASTPATFSINRLALLDSLSDQTASRLPEALPRIPGPLLDPSLSLLAGPREVPLEIQIPSLNLRAPVLGVGLTLTNAMAAPIGASANDPIWQTAFWYRGGGIPGDIGTATIAAHVTDDEGRPGLFGYLESMQAGDLIVVRDLRSDLDVSFIVTETQRYTTTEAAKPAVLGRVFGAAAGTGMTSSATDQLAHLTLITCAGVWADGSFDLRFVVYAVRATYPN